MKLDPPGPWEAAYRRSFLFRHNPDYLPLPTQTHESTTDDERQEFTLEIKPGSNRYRPGMIAKIEGYQQATGTDYGPSYPLLKKSSRIRGEVYSVNASWNIQPDWRSVAFGTGARYERVWSNSLEGGYAGRLHEFGYLQVQGEPFHAYDLPVRTALYSGVRADLYQGQQPFLHPNLGLEWGGGEVLYWSLRGELAGAYHLPSFNALFWQEDLQSRGNPNLKPERSLNREITSRIGYKDVGFTFSWFDRQVWDLIYWRLDFDNKWKPLNLRRAWFYGREITLDARVGEGLPSIDVNLSHHWLRALNQSGEPNTDGRMLPYRPLETTTMSVIKDLKYLSVDVSSRWVSRRYTNEANTKSLSPYAVWDAGITKAFNPSSGKTTITFRAEVYNLFDKSYRVIEKAPMPLREWRVSVSLEQFTF